MAESLWTQIPPISADFLIQSAFIRVHLRPISRPSRKSQNPHNLRQKCFKDYHQSFNDHRQCLKLWRVCLKDFHLSFKDFRFCLKGKTGLV